MDAQIRRGPWLSTFLILAAAVSAFSFCAYIVMREGILAKYPAWAFYAGSISSVLRFAAVIAIWFWSRAGVIVYTLLSLGAAPALSQLGISTGLPGLVGVAILIVLVWPRWKQMTWGIRRSDNEKAVA